MIKRIKTDVLIVGGGGGGAYAAIKLGDCKDIHVTLMTKGLLGRAGCSATFGYLHQPPKDFDKTFEHYVRDYSYYLIDQDYLKEALKAAPEIVEDWERLGLYYLKDEEGELLKTWKLLSPLQGNSGKGVMDVLRNEVFRRNVQVIENTTVTSLLLNNGAVVGATALNFLNGDFYVVQAKAVVLATGHTNYFWTRSTGTRDMCGNGLAMAYRAGAILQGIELIWWHIADIARPHCWRVLQMYPCQAPITLDGVNFVDSSGEVFHNYKWYPEHEVSYDVQCYSLVKRIKAGKARPDGGYYADFRHFDLDLFEKVDYGMTFLRKLGIDPRKDMVELAMTGHQMRGGVVVNTKMETNLPGLLISGSLSGAYLTGFHVCCWEGKVAAQTAAALAHSRDHLLIDETQVKQEEKRVFDWLNAARKGEYIPAYVKQKIRETMWEKMNFIKREKDMLVALEEIRGIREHMLPRMGFATDTLRFNYDLVDALDVVDMLDIIELIVLGSLERKESRGPFYREDYPEMDNKNWLKHLRYVLDGGKMKIYTAPVEFKYIHPE